MFVQETRWSPGALWTLVGFFLLVLLAVLAPAFALPPGHEERERVLGVLALTTALSAVVIACFYILRVVVDHETLSVGFGPFRERVPLERITACRPTTYRWWDWGGWGIRLGWRAKLYNVPGDHGSAVELTLVDGRRLLFSSHDPDAVCRALRERRPQIWEV